MASISLFANHSIPTENEMVNEFPISWYRFRALLLFYFVLFNIVELIEQATLELQKCTIHYSWNKKNRK